MIWLRPGIDGRDSMPALISLAVSPSVYPTAAPAIALLTMWMPGTGTRQSKEVPSFNVIVQEVPRSPWRFNIVGTECTVASCPEEYRSDTFDRTHLAKQIVITVQNDGTAVFHILDHL